MASGIIQGLLYVEMNDELGPNPVAWHPNTFTHMDLIHISIKTLTILSGEEGFIPESLVILPFPSKNLKGLVKYIKWEDTSRRGNIGQSALILLFQEIDDVIFYKYINDLSIPFNNLTPTIINLEKKQGTQEDYIKILEHLEFNISALLEELKLQEMSQQGAEAFPEQIIKDRGEIDYQFKIIIIGDPSVGKTSLILRYTDNAFRRSYVPTLGVHVTNKIFKVEDAIIQLTLWDIGGQVKFETMRQQFYRGADAAFLVFDLTRNETFSSIPKWHSDILNQLKKRRDTLIGFIIGNKNDLIEQRKVSIESVKDLASKLNLGFIETSALQGENVDYAFSNVATMLYKSRL